MQFRWVAVLALWTLLIGPVLDLAPARRERPAVIKAGDWR